MDVIELGCGTAYVSAWLAKRGAKPVGIDNSPKQLEAARGFQQEFGIDFPLMLGNAETVPLPDASFDLAVSEYGAALWADPYKWIPEAARLLRPGGRLAFMSNSDMVMMCVPDYEKDGAATDRLLRPYFGMYRFEWPDSDGVEFHLGHGDWIRLLRANGFEIEELIELRPPEGATTRLRLGRHRLGAQVAERGGLEGAQAVKRVVIAGGGFAGVSTAQELAKPAQERPAGTARAARRQ